MLVKKMSLVAFVVAVTSPAFAGAPLTKALQLPRISYEQQDPTKQLEESKLPSVLEREYTDAEIISCIESVCGPAAHNLSANDSLKPREVESATFKELWEKKIGRSVRMSMKASDDSMTATLLRAKALLEAGLALEKNHPVQSIRSFIFLSEKYLSKANELVELDQEKMRLLINEEKLSAFLSSIADETERKAVQVVITDLFAKTIDAPIDVLFSPNKLGARLKWKHPGLSPSEALKADATSLKKKLDGLRSALGPLLTSQLFQASSLRLLGEAEQGRDLSSGESDAYLTAAGNIEMFEMVYRPNLNQALLAVRLDTEEVLARIKSEKSIDRILAEKNAKTRAVQYAEVEKICRPRLSLAMSASASELRMNQTREMIGAIKTAAKKIAPSLVGNLQGIDLSKAIEEADFKMPDSSAETLARFRRGVLVDVEQSRSMHQAVRKGGADLDQLLLQMLPMLVDSISKSEGKHELAKLCESLVVSKASDFALSAQGKISVSWFTVAYPEHGLGILAHELGHVVSSKARALTSPSEPPNGFEKSLNCVANRNPFVVEPTHLTASQNTQSSEEDWADHFASLVLNELDRSKSPWARYGSNKGCALIPDVGDRYGSAGIQASAGDTHSSGILRLLMISLDRKQLTPACQPLLDYTPANGQSLTCEK